MQTALIPQIVKFVGNSFSLIFIDPTGWTGYSLKEIKPLFDLRGEILINFMFDYVNRFLENPKPEIARTFDPLFGGVGWERDVFELVASGVTREDAILDVYKGRVRGISQFSHVTSTRILKPLSDRAFFHLVYGTKNWKGVVEFRKVEERLVEEQERTRNQAKYLREIDVYGRDNLFGPDLFGFRPSALVAEREKQLRKALAHLQGILRERRKIKYKDLLGLILERPLVWPRDVDIWIKKMRQDGNIEIPEMSLRERTPKPNHTIIFKKIGSSYS